ncbi:MAG TPA: hypothetical protein VJQ45_07935, partial [Ktedonobacterales bacterium]|nr:hypothetical protein [Ktedonobacterales bacterium]
MAMRAGASHGRSQPQQSHRRQRSGGWSRSQWLSALVGLVLGGALAYGYVSYLRGGDISPDSRDGYIFAILGTLLLIIVGAGYALRKRLWRGRFGLLHTALSWHVVGGILALALIFAHSAGNFHPRTGSYALYSLIALVVSGIIGKQLDRIAPRLAARAALKTLTFEGEERLDALVSTLPHKRQRKRARSHSISQQTRQAASSAPWDLAYYDLSVPPEEIPVLLQQQQRGSAHAVSPAVEGALAYGYVSYLRGGDISPDSRDGYIFAILGTL